jgi:CheY-like chemotaxis protein
MTQARTILVVEDQDQVRTMVVRILCAEGFRVVEAADGLQALALLDKRTDVDLVLSDIVMPRMDGLQLAAHLSGKSKTPVLLMTGYTDQHWSHPAPVPVLYKPLSPELLTAEIKRIIEARAA